MKTVIAPGNVIETMTSQEAGAHLDRAVRQLFQEQARGLTTFRFGEASAVDGSGGVTVPGLGEDPIGPRPGFAWRVEAVRGQGLADGDVVSVYRNSVHDSNFIEQLTAAAPAVKLGKGCVLHGDEKLIFTGSSLTATGDVTVSGEGFEVGEPDLYKLV